VLEARVGRRIDRKQFLESITSLQYERSDFGFHRGTFRVRGDVIDMYPAYEDVGVRVELKGEIIDSISTFNPVSGDLVKSGLTAYVLYPAKHYMTDPRQYTNVFEHIRNDLDLQVQKLKGEGKLLEANRIAQKVNYDLEMIQELGYVKGIENYSRYFDGRNPGDPPYTLLDYFRQTYGKDWLLMVDESHITFPQIRGMYSGDASRKQTLIDYGFRLPSALDNRPLKFEEFLRSIDNFIAVSATPADWELSMAQGNLVEQLVRPTGIVDPEVEIRPIKGQVRDVIEEVRIRAAKHERVLITSDIMFDGVSSTTEGVATICFTTCSTTFTGSGVILATGIELCFGIENATSEPFSIGVDSAFAFATAANPTLPNISVNFFCAAAVLGATTTRNSGRLRLPVR
jgi:excinuclease ABC subunit B